MIVFFFSREWKFEYHVLCHVEGGVFYDGHGASACLELEYGSGSPNHPVVALVEENLNMTICILRCR